MKKPLILLSTLIFSNLAFSQITMFSESPNMNTVLFKNKIYDMELSKDIQGSPYIYEDFTVGRIDNVEGLLTIRYNAYKDDVEIKQNNLVYIIPREERFSVIEIVPTNEFLVLEKYTQKGIETEGYLFLLIGNKNLSLLKKEKIIFKDAERARNSYAEPKPAQFTNLKTEYFIKKDGKIFDLPRNKKGLISLFPEKKITIENYFKNNKVDFNNDKSLKDFFSSIL